MLNAGIFSYILKETLMKTTEEQIKDINKGNLKNSPFFICPYRDTLNIWIKIIGDRL